MDNKNTSADGGIIAQYGFHFQKIVFVYSILSTLSTGNLYTYEGIDDVEISQEDDPLVQIEVSKEKSNDAIQVKSGTVDKDRFCKLVGNWLLSEATKPALYTENPITTVSRRVEAVNALVEFFNKGKEQKKTSIANRVFNKYHSDSESDEGLKLAITDVLDNANFLTLSSEELWIKSQELFIKNYCDDIKLFEKAKEERFCRFFDEVNSEIERCMGNKRPCVLGYSDVLNIIFHTREEISDHRYEIDVNAVRKKKKKTAEKLVSEGNSREVRQLLEVNQRQGFVVNEIVKELLYKDFRNIYADSLNSKKISSVEAEAYLNHEDTMYEIEDPSPREDFYATTRKDLHSDLMPDSSLYRNGCYVYLTSDDVPEDRKITWGGEAE